MESVKCRWLCLVAKDSKSLGPVVLYNLTRTRGNIKKMDNVYFYYFKFNNGTEDY